MKQQDIVPLLQSFGFQGLSLVSAEGNTTTMKFTAYDHSGLVKSLGQPTVAGGGKVAVFNIPKVARLGISPANSVLRFISDADSASTSQHHLGMVKVPKAYSAAYLKAAVNPALRVKFIQKLWDLLNKEKFEGKMEQPALTVKPALGPGVRAHYIGRYDFRPGKIEVAEFLFNAREPFFLEIFLHEMCHQAAREISRSLDASENGHGPVWQRWMVDVGLDPRRFDPTDEAEYQTQQEYLANETKLIRSYGPRAKESMVNSLKRMTGTPHGVVIMLFRGRLLEGVVTGKNFHGKNIVNDQTVSIGFNTAQGILSNPFFHKA